MTEANTRMPVALPLWPRAPMASGRRLVNAFFAGRNARTVAAYRQDLECFRLFAGADTLTAAAERLLSQGQGEANALALAYKAELVERKLSAATINRRLAALRSLVKLARTLGIVPWTLEVQNVKAKAYRDTRGPGRRGFCEIMAELGRRPGAKAKRDRAAIRLLFDLALRRGEVVALDVADVELEAGTVAVLGKGETDKVKLTLPEPTQSALADWLEVRGREPGPLFVNFDRAAKGERLTGTSLYRIVSELGCKAGVKARPHGLRHAAITEALDLMQGDLRAVQRYSRHKDVRTLNVYDDNRADLAGEVARRVAGETP
jgi:integrase/recombinase XerC